MAENQKIAQPSLVLFHGWGLNSGVWQGVKALLPDRCNLITPDLPGFGQNRDFPASYQLAEVVAQLAEQVPDNSYVCGWSLGGLLAIALAKQYPHKVARLGLCAASPCFLATTDWPGMQAKVLQQFAAALSENIALTIQRFLAIQAMGSEHARADIQQLRQTIAAYPLPEPAAVQGALRLLAEQDLRNLLPSLSQPVSGCFGRLDSLVPVGVVPLLQQLVPSGKFTVFEKASHAPFISHLPDFVQWLTNWAELAD
ncbi:pimeloyl-[acyl-carrier protein] methyl ester esterase [Alishewanella longhuensis]|uniref:Pimeloyl-[acyl-carrier protein] methyl ester esterase n=1 Tax=Alishewanella longhuensis TaxID=1091037 RepID=A0ABQ3L3R7_9ALTE|nr:pimeloyl-ACP methyl ester esterase BioH [Alishewanella longhuensis]GHG75465.1 pimeloyl-[acyl-carrier protein] methyl ester esterase [Alishewanella longhuensis]